MLVVANLVTLTSNQCVCVKRDGFGPNTTAEEFTSSFITCSYFLSFSKK